MAPDSHQRVRQLFDEALERPEAERLPFVETACAGNPTLLQAVERLLRARVASESFLEDKSRKTQRIGRYLIRRELGRGAMGVVYEAIDPLIGRSVAVKVIRLKDVSEPGEAEFLTERLFREARSAGQLFHPGIVIILDVGREGDSAFIAMECVGGPTLEEILNSGRSVTAALALRILQQTAAALDYAHQHGIVHRDIKPANIMLHDEVSVKVADFGIAKIMSGRSTVTGVVMGTPSYMSPEQIEARPVDGRSDQFSLAVVAFQLLTRVRPFEADSLATLAHLIVFGQRRSARDANPALPAAVDEVFERAFGRLPEQRFSTCTEFVAALDSAVNQPQAAAAEPLRAIEKTRVAEPAGKRSRLGYLFGLAAAAVVLAAALLFYKHPYFHVAFTQFAQPAALNAAPAPGILKTATAAPHAPLKPPTAPAAAPVIRKFSVYPASVESGKLATLSWDVTGANSVAIDHGIGKVAALGSLAVTPTDSTAYVLTSTGPAGDVHATASVNVEPKPVSASARAELLYNLALDRRHDGQLQEAFALFRQSAELGNASAMAGVGESYRDGEGVDQDAGEALRWFDKAARAGNSSAMVSLGAMYFIGDGVDASDEQAVQWYAKAAARANSAGIYDLGMMYEEGRGVPENLDKAKELYQKASGLGNGEARRRLAKLLDRK